jgi:prepilin-type N-terminal cleavage/methylation domain-containing protein/prepilin-type processing-associated H-X9-DG protein
MVQPPQFRSAFSLIEMLVVISIITLLISILQPSLASSRHHARIANCAANQRSMANAIGMYADDTRHYPVGLDHHADNAQRIWLWPPQVRMYTQKEQGIFNCPQAPASTQWIKKSSPGEIAFYGYEQNEMRIRGNTHKFSYGYNVWGAFMNPSDNKGLGIYRLQQGGDATPIHAVKKASDMIAFSDSNVNDYWSGFIGPYRTGQFPSRIHFGKANIAFVDSHVTLMGRNETVDTVMDNQSPVNKRWNIDHSFRPGVVQNDGVPEFP